MNSTASDTDDDAVLKNHDRHPVSSGLSAVAPSKWSADRADGILTGLSAEIAERLRVDPLWIRLAFIGTALLSGLGIVVYVGLWIALIVARSTAVRALGWTIVIGGFLVLTGDGLDIATGPVAVMALLAGLALVLWKPVPSWVTEAPAAAPRSAPEVTHSVSQAAPYNRGEGVRGEDGRGESGQVDRGGHGDHGDHSVRSHAARPKPVARPPSILGRASLGIAILVASIGALVDQLNGGRLHPEQWLGAAGVACGLGLLVGAVRGHARWLILPAIGFAAAGYVCGIGARTDVAVDEFFTNASSWVNAGSVGDTEVHTAFGSASIYVEEAPTEPVTFDVRSANGLDLYLVQEATVEIRSQLGEVTLVDAGLETSASTFTLGPEGEPDIVINLRLTRGKVDLTYWPPIEEFPPTGGEFEPQFPLEDPEHHEFETDQFEAEFDTDGVEE